MRYTRTILYRIGLRWHWKIVSAWDGSLIAQGSHPRQAACRELASAKHQELRKQAHENHRSH